MQGQDILQTIAEISVAFAGFTGVVLAFGRRTDRAWSPLDVYRFRVLVGASLQALLLALLPFLLHHAGLPEGTTWAICSFAVCALLTAVTITDMRYLAPLRSEIGRADRTIGALIAVGFVCVFVVQLANVVGAFAAGAFAAYLSALIYYLAISSLMFLRLLSGVGLEPR